MDIYKKLQSVNSISMLFNILHINVGDIVIENYALVSNCKTYIVSINTKTGLRHLINDDDICALLINKAGIFNSLTQGEVNSFCNSTFYKNINSKLNKV